MDSQSNGASNNNNNRGAPATPPAPPPLPPRQPNTLNDIRQTYLNLFNQILDNSININCICKTTTLRARPAACTNDLDESASFPPRKKLHHNNNHKKTNFKKLFDYNSYLSDEDEDEDDDKDVEIDDMANEKWDNISQQNTNSCLDSAFAYSYGLGSFLRDSDYDESGVNQNMCDLSCFEKMRFVHTKLKESVLVAQKSGVGGESNQPEESSFERLWTTFKFLCKCPTSCDYYGTTIFHYAATDENPELLKCCLRKFPDGVKCIDSKGMTPLMRAVQRNNMECVRYLLNSTASDLNGSAQSTYTPLWFAVSNGYNDLALLLLNYNASSSMVEKSISSAIPLPTSVANTLLQSEDMSGGIVAPPPNYHYRHHHRLHSPSRFHASASSDPPSTTNTASYLFSPLRASIVYSRFQIMSYLLEFNANVYELFNVSRLGCSSTSKRGRLPRPGPLFNPKLNEDYLNSLKFFHRQFAIDEQQLNAAASSSSSSSSTSSSSSSSPPATLSAAELENQLNILNEFIDDVNVYRRMLIEFVKNLVQRLNSNLSLVDRLYDYLNSISKANTIDYIIKMNEAVSRNDEDEDEDEYEKERESTSGREMIERVEWLDYLAAVRQFIDSLEKFLNLTPENSFNFNLHSNNSLIRKPNYNQSVFEFAVRLVDMYHRPKSLKQLARFRIREMLFDRIDGGSGVGGVKYNEMFLKRDHLNSIVRGLDLPNGLDKYVLFN